MEKARHKMEGNIYAVKKVRLHLSTDGSIMDQIKNHKTYREVIAMSTTLDLKANVVIEKNKSIIESKATKKVNRAIFIAIYESLS